LNDISPGVAGVPMHPPFKWERKTRYIGEEGGIVFSILVSRMN
jgi:hypothetical protein